MNILLSAFLNQSWTKCETIFAGSKRVKPFADEFDAMIEKFGFRRFTDDED